MKDQARLVLPDLHIPFQNKKLLACWLRRLEDNAWDGVDIIGDMIDCFNLSRFDKNPARKANIQKEIDDASDLLAYIRTLLGRDADIQYSEGNHEDRLRKLLWGKSRQLGDLRNLTIPELMDLNKHGVTWHSAANPYKIGDLWYTHGDVLRKHGSQSARAKSDAIKGSVIMGHCHRMGWSPYTTWETTLDGFEVGHMTDYTQLDYVQTAPNWQLGWAEVFFVNGVHIVNFIRVVKHGREDWVLGPDGLIDHYRRVR